MIGRHFQSDAVTKEIVAQCRDEGLLVFYWIGVNRQKGQPDLIIPYGGTTWLVEVKKPGRDLDPDQESWHSEYLAAGGGPILTVHSFAELAIGIGFGEPIPGDETT